MTANIEISETGKASFAFVGEPAWHRLGTEMKPGASFDEWRVEAGYNFSIKESPVQFDVGGEMVTVQDRKVLYRDDNRYPLGIVSKTGYHVVQPQQILDYFKRLADKMEFPLETAGVLNGGKQYFALARVSQGQSISRLKTDIVDPYLLLATSADGSLATHGLFTLVRVVCQNTLRASLDTKEKFTLRHRSVFTEDKMNAGLGIDLREQYEETMTLLRTLGDTKMAAVDMVKATLNLMEPALFRGDDVEPEQLIKVLNKRDVRTVVDLSLGHNMIGNDLLRKGTTGSWLQSVTEYYDHNIMGRGANKLDNAAYSSLFGVGSNLKAKALEIAADYKRGDLPSLPGVSDDDLMNAELVG